MNRNTRTAAVLVLSVVFASLAGFGVYRAISRIPVREVEVDSYQVVVAAAPLSMGTLLTAENVRLVSWPARSPVAGGFTDMTSVVNRGLLISVVENEPITATRLAPTEAGGGLPPSIPTGMRAMSVKVNEVIGVAGFVVPGTRVDVLVTIRRGEDDTMTRTVVSNVQVLTAGTRYDQENARDGEPIPSTVVTLMVTPADAERITLAQVQGQIMLALRNPLDTVTTDTPGIRTAALMGQAAAPAPVVTSTPSGPRVIAQPPPPPAPVPVNRVYSVEVIRAAERTQEVVR
jgi:pilus assembly protein CpaB